MSRRQRIRAALELIGRAVMAAAAYLADLLAGMLTRRTSVAPIIYEGGRIEYTSGVPLADAADASVTLAASIGRDSTRIDGLFDPAANAQMARQVAELAWSERMREGDR